LQFSDFDFVPLDFFGCFSLLLDHQKLLFGFGQLFSLLPQFGQLGPLAAFALASWFVSHPISGEKPDASHMCARI
jgi:hypothetical protein